MGKDYFIAEIILAIFITLVASLAHSTVIEAEDYDKGGEGVAYHDTDAANHGNTDLRQEEGVDLWGFDDNEGVYHVKVGSVKAGEWVNYTIDFEITDFYNFKFWVATPQNGANLIIKLDGVSYNINDLPNTGSYREFTTVEQIIEVTKGVHTLTVEFDGESSDLDKFEFTPTSDLTDLGLKEKHDYITYAAYTSKKFTVGWDAVEHATWYEIRIFNMERNVYVDIEDYKTHETMKTFNFPYSGHFVPQIKACAIIDEETKCSSWSSANNAEVATVDGKPRAWWLYGFIEPPGEIEH